MSAAQELDVMPSDIDGGRRAKNRASGFETRLGCDVEES